MSSRKGRPGRDLAYALGTTRGGKTVVTRTREVLGVAKDEGRTLTAAADLETGERLEWSSPAMRHNTRLLPWRGSTDPDLYPEFELNAKKGLMAGEDEMHDLLDEDSREALSAWARLRGLL